DVLREADWIVVDEIKKAGLYRQVWQSFAVLTPLSTVGVMGDGRTYANVVAVRIVTSEDAMTADWARVPYEVLGRISNRIVNGGTGGLARNVAVQADDVAGLVRLAKREKVGLVVLGPESAVAAGAGDALRDAGFPVFGPSRAAGRIESSKAFAKELMARAGIP